MGEERSKIERQREERRYKISLLRDEEIKISIEIKDEYGWIE